MRFGIVQKLVAGIVGVSITTYGCSAFFIFVLKDRIAPEMPQLMYITLVLAAGVFWSGFLGWLAAKWLVRPLLRLTGAVNEASTGNLRVAIPIPDSSDEIAALSASVHKMMDSLRLIVGEISNTASLANQSASSLTGVINDAAGQIESISRTAESISDGADHQSSSADGTLLSVEQMTIAAGNVRTKAEHALQLSLGTVHTIERSGETVRSLVNGINELTSSSSHSIGLVQQLDESAREIGSISRMVGEIADQTQLLALNASIEAARAGEHGLGFSVVAGEIRKLSEQCASAVGDINGLIGQIQANVRYVVGTMKRQVDSVLAEAQKGESAGQALDLMKHSVKEAAVSVEEIVGVISDQEIQINHTLNETRDIAGIAKQISGGARKVASAVQDQTAVMQEIAASSEILRDQADRLKEKVKVFRV
ncbi:methyl-accepting chemotaxis protein [Paenibacillus sp. MBLB4367]|uniref:methyl-accepting chemotaxis protein n=1 Tax=Paenibacillus sp. MBLB4367 TaxID=3384767 RepID=UPI003908390A